jgi:dTDP-glucose pyrophosphorylase
MEVIIPCAGFSTRFPKMRPKYLLADYLNRRMIELSAAPYLSNHRVHAVILKQHDELHGVSRIMHEIFGDQLHLVILDEPTSGPAETIRKALDLIGMSNHAPFLVHDCDSIFDHDHLGSGNEIMVSSLTDHTELRTPSNKSYVSINDQGIVVSVMEKKIISDLFCVGGYQFISAGSYRRAYDCIKDSRLGEIYVSSVIDQMISAGEVFTTRTVNGFVDLGTKEDWMKFNDRPTIFCDIDGTIICNQSPYGDNNYSTPPRVLANNVQALLRSEARGCQLIFTTSRSSKWKSETDSMLRELGFNSYQLIMDLHHSRRILINDHAPTNPYPSAVAINIKRDDDCLDQLLEP